MSIFRASIPVGIGLGLLWGLKGLGSWPIRGQAGDEPVEQVLARLPQHNGRRATAIEGAVVGRMVEMVGRGAIQTLRGAPAASAGSGAGRAIYVDPHIIALYTARPIVQTKHGIRQRVVKALVKLRVVSADWPGRVSAFQLGQGELSFQACLEAAVDLTTWTTGKPVELVGVDRGALSQANPERFEVRAIGLTVWSEDTPTMRRSPAAVEGAAFHDAEHETVRRVDGRKVRRLKTRGADVPDMVINGQGYRCRTIAVEDVRSGHRIGIHAVGRPTHQMTARQIPAFMRGKQRFFAVQPVANTLVGRRNASPLDKPRR